MRVHHVGVATDDGRRLADRYVAAFGATVAHEETVEGLSLCFLEFEGTYVELLEPIDEDGVVARYLDRHGPGIHHVAFATDDLDAALERARAAGVERIDDAPRRGAWGTEVVFFHPKSTGGVLVELVST